MHRAQVGKFPSHLRRRPLSQQMTTPILAVLLIGRPFKFSVISMPRENSPAVRGRGSIRIFFDGRRKKESGHSRRGFLSRETRERGELCKLQPQQKSPADSATRFLPTDTFVSRPLPIFPKITPRYIERLEISRSVFYFFFIFFIVSLVAADYEVVK